MKFGRWSGVAAVSWLALFAGACAHRRYYLDPSPACSGTAMRVGGFVGDSLEVDQLPRLHLPTPVLPIPPGRPPDAVAHVVAEFVVDSLGLPLPCTWRVIQASDEAYVPQAYHVMRSLRFTPGRKGDRPVAVLVQEAFNWGD